MNLTVIDSRHIQKQTVQLRLTPLTTNISKKNITGYFP